MKTKFFEKAKIKFGDKFDLNHVDYVNSSTDITIVCPKHGEFVTTPSKFIHSKHGCPKCAHDFIGMQSRKTSEQFISQCKELYGSKYSYSKTNYINADEKVVVTCNIHGDFLTRPADFIRGHGCPKCKGDITSNFNKTTKRYSQEDFIKKANDLYENLFSYDEVIYINSRTKVKIYSNICNESFLITPSKFLSGDIKKKYLNIKVKEQDSLNFDIFVQRAKLIHGDKYDYSKVEYKSYKDKVCIICPKHGEFWQTPVNHLSNLHACPMCSQSRGEEFISTILDNLKINYERQFVININNHNYRVDFFWKYKDKTIFIEYNGKQHYQPVEIFGGQETFEKQIQRDNDVRKYCADNAIILLEYPYSIEFNDLRDVLKEDIQSIIE